MPIYEFECGGCGTFEVSRPMAALRPVEPCPRCRAEAPRVFSAFGLLRGKSQQGGARAGSGEPGAPKVVRSAAAGEERNEARTRRKAAPEARSQLQAAGHGRPWMMGH